MWLVINYRGLHVNLFLRLDVIWDYMIKINNVAVVLRMAKAPSDDVKKCVVQI